jgi:signal transduction histidine kinase
LFTSALLRLVIWRGLIQPLRGFTHELEQLEADSLGSHVVSPAEQPSEFRSIVEAFNQLQARLAEAWQRERRFVDGVAHELRTPITVISSHAQRLQAEPSQNSPAAVALIAAEAKRLGELISVMLDFARVDAGRLTLAVLDHDPEVLLLGALERLQGVAPDRLQLAPSVEGDLPRIRADADRVHQCLAALVDNALRYSDGAVQLAVSPSSTGVTLHVHDQGPGIPIAERDQVLERFVRGSSSSGTQGSGLGLAIVNDLMRAMQGELLIGDAPGGGADLQLRFKISDRQLAP